MSKQEFIDRLTDPEAIVAREMAAEFIEYIETINLEYVVWDRPYTDILTVEVYDKEAVKLSDLDAVYIDYCVQYRIGHLCYMNDDSHRIRRYQIKKGQRRRDE